MSELPHSDYDFKVQQIENDDWIVLDLDGKMVAGPFEDPVDAGQWARDELVRRHEAWAAKKQGGSDAETAT